MTLLMLNTILESLKLKVSNDDQDARRAHERREADSCIGVIDGISYPVSNWSKGGVLLAGDDRQFSLNDIKTVKLRFKLRDRVVDILHSGRILRKGSHKFVIEFSPLTQNIDRQFNYVVDDYMSSEFANSQS